MLIAIILIATSLALPARVVNRYFDDTRAVNHVFGWVSSAKYMQKYRIGGIRNLSFMLGYVNKNLPSDSVVLMLFEARSFYFRPRAIQDVKRTNWPLLSKVLTPDECLQRVDVTHVLINQGSLNYAAARGSKFSPAGLNALQLFTEHCLELVHETQAHRLYKLKKQVTRSH